MRVDLETIKKMEAYLTGTMDPETKKAFELEISTNTELKNAVEQQRNLMKAMENIYVKNAAKKAGQKVRMYSWLKKGGVVLTVLVILTVVFVGYHLVTNNLQKNKENTFENIIIPDIEKGRVYDPGAFIPSQYFEIDGNKDTVIVGANGTMFAIPAGTFTDASNNSVTGKITVELKEALDPGTIMLSGLSTFSGDQPLETGGMFYINAKANGNDLKIGGEGILTSVPQNESKTGMMMFDGVVDKNGNIDWVNPQQPENYLLPVDIRALDFYPRGFVDAINRDLDHTSEDQILTHESESNNFNKKLSKPYTDSLYLSFEFLENNYTSDSLSFDYPKDSLDGRQLFKMNCARCHYINDQKMIGPGLKGVRSRWKREQDLYAFIRDSKSFLQTGDKYANDLFKAYNGSLKPSFNLYDEEIAAILQYIETGEDNDGRPMIGYKQGIRPSKVLAFWQSAFNQTFLATKEFESRMPLIHQTCNNAILDLYIKNLDKNLYEVDSMAAKIAGGLALEFLKFAAMRHGRIPNGDKKYDMLQKFYQRQAYVMAQAAIVTTKAFYTKNWEADLDALRRGSDYSQAEFERKQQLFTEEYDLNLKKACKDLGYPLPVKVSGRVINQIGPRFNTVITNLGWKNIDRRVEESLIARTTLDFTDTTTGKRTVIEYKEMIANVTNANEFDMVNVYLIPDNLTTYMKVNGSQGKYSEKLNMTMQYDVYVIAYKNKQVYFNAEYDVLPSSYTFTLSDDNITPVQALLGKLGGKRNTESLQMAVNYSMFKIADDERRTKYSRIIADRERLKPIVFPCNMDMPKDTLFTEQLYMPNLIGMTSRQATAKMKSMGINNVSATAPKDCNDNCVVVVQEPKPGTKVNVRTYYGLGFDFVTK